MVMITETPAAVMRAAVERRGRKLTSVEAVERRRLSRRATALIKKAGSATAESMIKERMAMVVRRMIRRYVPLDRHGEALLHEYDYWSLRRLGYDVYAEELRWTGKWVDGARTVRELCEPAETETWRWWRRLNWQTRLKVSGASAYIIRGLAPQQSFVICNPAFEVVQRCAGEDFVNALDE